MGALGGMLILVSYFLTAAISCLSAIHYLSVVLPAIGPYIVWITIGVLALLGLLNWLGISESAKVSLIAAIVAFGSDLAIIFTVFTHIPISELPFLFGRMFAHATLTPSSLLVGFAGAFLAFSGLESISQLSPVMKAPRKKIIGLALALVVITIGITSPLLTMLSTLLQQDKATDPVLATQLLSLLGGHWGNILLQTEVAISASLILIFASNTAVIGAYHVFMALSRMEFFPEFILNRNRLRGTPHWSIALAVGIPIAVLVLVNGNINLLGDLYAFGLLGAFTLTCLGLDIVRYRERRRAAGASALRAGNTLSNGFFPADSALSASPLTPQQSHPFLQMHLLGGSWLGRVLTEVASSLKRSALGLWQRFEFELGLVTTLLVVLAWSISLVSKPLATAFGGSVVLVGLAVAAVGYVRGRIP